jgi:hypothetical protein
LKQKNNKSDIFFGLDWRKKSNVTGLHGPSRADMEDNKEVNIYTRKKKLKREPEWKAGR